MTKTAIKRQRRRGMNEEAGPRLDHLVLGVSFLNYEDQLF